MSASPQPSRARAADGTRQVLMGKESAVVEKGAFLKLNYNYRLEPIFIFIFCRMFEKKCV